MPAVVGTVWIFVGVILVAGLQWVGVAIIAAYLVGVGLTAGLTMRIARKNGEESLSGDFDLDAICWVLWPVFLPLYLPYRLIVGG